MWTIGRINGCIWEVKHYDEGSIYGIDGGRISKLWIRREDNCEILANYDCGWDIKPTSPEGIEIYNMLLKKFN